MPTLAGRNRRGLRIVTLDYFCALYKYSYLLNYLHMWSTRSRGLTADQLAVTCTGYPLKRPSPPDPRSAAAAARSGSRRGRAAATSAAGRREAPVLAGGGTAGLGETGPAPRTNATAAAEKTFDAAESFRRRVMTGDGRPRRRSSLPSMKVRFEEPLATAVAAAAGGSTADGSGFLREPTTTTTVDEEDLSG